MFLGHRLDPTAWEPLLTTGLVCVVLKVAYVQYQYSNDWCVCFPLPYFFYFNGIFIFCASFLRQLILLLELYSPRDVYDYLRPIALNLCADKVSSVRWISYKLVCVKLLYLVLSHWILSRKFSEEGVLLTALLFPQVSEMVKKLHMATPPTFGVDLINELVENFGRCPKWSGRQAFVFVCQVKMGLSLETPVIV